MSEPWHYFSIDVIPQTPETSSQPPKVAQGAVEAQKKMKSFLFSDDEDDDDDDFFKDLKKSDKPPTTEVKHNDRMRWREGVNKKNIVCGYVCKRGGGQHQKGIFSLTIVCFRPF